MGRFLGETITYINQADVSNALRFVRQNPDATQRAVRSSRDKGEDHATYPRITSAPT